VRTTVMGLATIRLKGWLLGVLACLACTLCAGSVHADDPPEDTALHALGRTETSDLPEVPPPADLSALLGKPIARIDVRVRGAWGPIPKQRSLRVGDPIDVERIRTALRELLDAGGLANAAVSVVDEPGGVVVVFEVEARRVLAGALVEGGVLDVDRTLRAAKLSRGALLTESSLADAKADIVSYYGTRGFRRTHVAIETTPATRPGELDVRIVIEPGVPRIVDLRIFVISPEQDAQVGELKRTYAVETDDRADDEALAEADRKLTELLRQRGFIRAKVTHQLRNVGDVAHARIRVDSGPLVTPIFEGNQVFDGDQLTEALRSGGASWGTEQELAERVRVHYVQRGYLDVEVKTSTRVGLAAVENLVFTIREGSPVRVVKRVYPCLPKQYDAGEVGEEVSSFLDEELPSGTFEPPDPDALDPTLGPTDKAPDRVRLGSVNAVARYAPDTYGRAVKHLKDLFGSRGYLHSAIGPVRVVRGRCSPSSTSRHCAPEPIPDLAHAVCAIDASGIPIAEPALPDPMSCESDPAHGVECSPEVTLRIPMNLGPQTVLYDVAFDVSDRVKGSARPSDSFLALIARLPLGQPLSNQDVEKARQRLLESYREYGHYYADIRADLELSPDKTRGRVRFSISPREIVRIKWVEIRGARFTNESVVRRRLVFAPGDVYSKSAVRTSEERIATLGPFTSVTIELANPEVPEREKNVIVTVAEDLPIYVEPRIGFSTGEGIRGGLEVGHRTLWGEAISLTIRTQFAYLFDFMILDQDYRDNLEPLPKLQRLERRNSARMVFPEIGLGPLFGLALEGVDIRDNQRDFGLTRDAFVPALLFRPSREVSAQLANSLELNDVRIFNADSVEDAIRANRSLERLLRFPDGRTVAVAQRISGSWDRRDNAFAATKGTLFTAEIEHVNAFPANQDTENANPITSHFMRLSGRVAGYVRFTRSGLSLALSMSSGGNVQLVPDSRTYPDRLFFLGGFNNHRAFLTDSLVPEDVAQRILNPDVSLPEDERLTIDDIGVRGGDLSLNPRAELRIPLGDTFATCIFVDAGNVWVDPAAVDPFAMRYGAGSGVRINTPIGPLALDYGVNLQRRPWEDFGAVHFSVGLF